MPETFGGFTRRPKQARRSSTGASAAARARLGQVATSTEMRALAEPRTSWAIRDIVFDFACIGAAVGFAILCHNIVVAVVAATYIGFLQRRLSNLLHELSHLKLFPGRRANYFVGFGISWLMMLSFHGYHDEHSEHHAFLGSDADPKLRSYRARGATTPRRDKIDFLIRVIGVNVIWDLPKATVTAWARQEGTSRERAGRAVIWSLITLAAWSTDNVGWVVVLWIVPLLFIRPAVNMVTDQINHLGLIQDGDILRQTRGFSAHPVVLHLIAGHHDDAWHPVHHLMSRIQHRRLSDAFVLIARERPDLVSQIPWCSGLIWRRRSTPDVPAVLEQVIGLLKDQSLAVAA